MIFSHHLEQDLKSFIKRQTSTEPEAVRILETRPVEEILRTLKQLWQKGLLEGLVYLQLQQDIFTAWSASS